MDEALRAHTFNEVGYYLMVAACPSCGKGPRQWRNAAVSAQTGQPVSLPVRCDHCGHQQDVTFCFEHEVPGDGTADELINPTDHPSRIVDLSQWLSLFSMLIESVRRVENRPVVRQAGFRAALCLAEALKFYQDNELPPVEAFFTPEGQAAFRHHPEKFARQRLRDMQAKLPALPAMMQRLRQDGTTCRRPWWQFWKG